MLRTLAFLVVLIPASALACSGSDCIAYLTYPKSGALPANMVVIDIQGREEQRAALKLYRVDTRAEVPSRSEELPPDDEYRAWFRIWPTEPLPNGTQLELAPERIDCDGNAYPARFTVGEAQPLPTQLGRLQVRVERIEQPTRDYGGGCAALLDVSAARFEIELAEDAKPYAARLRYLLEVDGKPHPHFYAHRLDAEGDPPGQDRIFAVCRMLQSAVLQGSNVTKGKHRVRMLGLLPNVSTVLATPEVEVDLQCTSDAGTPVLVPDAGVDHDAGTERTRNDGCALGAPSGHAWLLALALLLRRRVHS